MSERRALLITDVVDSTGLTERLGDAAAARLWAAHDRLARDLLPAHHGREIDKTDGLLLLFDAAADAAAYALAYQHALRSLEPPLAARAGLHVGPVILRENPATDVARGAKPVEVEGIAKATAARIMALARGGQTLLSADARDALDAGALRIVSHGHWRLQGLPEPIELFETADAQAACLPPADHPKAYRVVRDGELWRPAREIRHNLAAERDAFVGRARSLAALAREFDGGARLVCVTGIGGAGKSRLATRFARAWLGEFDGGAWFCDLSQARGIDAICHALGQALDVPLGRDDPVVQLGHAIAARGRCLLILDNFEQVAGFAQATLGRWLDRAAQACFLVTSRAVLGLSGERVLALPPLPATDAAALFMRRAEAATRGFAPQGEDRAAIAPLVELLDGLPLAIELAAARVSVMSPRMLLARMSERFKLLAAAGGRGGRQATLRATFDWSWDLLTDAEKAALAQLSVFEGGFDLDAAEALLDLSAVADPPWPPDVLQSLVEKSFLRRSDERFDMFVSVREYAAEHLRTPGRFTASGAEAAVAAERRHAGWYAGLDESQATRQRCVELGNLIVACRRSVAHGDAVVAAAALERAWAALRLRGPFQVGVDLAAGVCAVPDLPPAAAARAHCVAGCAVQALGRGAESRQRFGAGLALARQVGDLGCEARLLCHLGNLDAIEGRLDEAAQCLTRALALTRDAGDEVLECEVLNGLGNVDGYLERIDPARSRYEAALALSRRIGDRRWEGGVLGNLGSLDTVQGRWNEARLHYEAGLVIARELGDRKWEGNALCNLGLVLNELGHIALALETLESGLRVARDLGHARLEAIVSCNLGIVLEAMGRPDDALARYDAAVEVAAELGDRRSEGQFLSYLGLLLARERRLDDARARLDRGEQLLRAVSDQSALGVLLCARAQTEWLAGAHASALAQFAEAQAVAATLGAAADSELAVALARVRAIVAEPPGA